MNEQMHESINSLPLDLLYSAQFLFSESISPGRTVGRGEQIPAEGLRRGQQALVRVFDPAAVGVRWAAGRTRAPPELKDAATEPRLRDGEKETDLRDT